MKLLFAVVLLILAGCTTADKPEPAPTPDTRAADISYLKSRLNMNRPNDQLGFAETRFNGCDLGFAPQHGQPCAPEYLAILHFQILCRDSEGTVDTISQSQLVPVVSNSVQWRMGNSRGLTQTDHEGFGQIQVIRPRSSARDRVRLTVAGQFLVMSAAELRQVVVPKTWCQN